MSQLSACKQYLAWPSLERKRMLPTSHVGIGGKGLGLRKPLQACMEALQVVIAKSQAHSTYLHMIVAACTAPVYAYQLGLGNHPGSSTPLRVRRGTHTSKLTLFGLSPNRKVKLYTGLECGRSCLAAELMGEGPQGWKELGIRLRPRARSRRGARVSRSGKFGFYEPESSGFTSRKIRVLRAGKIRLYEPENSGFTRILRYGTLYIANSRFSNRATS